MLGGKLVFDLREFLLFKDNTESFDDAVIEHMFIENFFHVFLGAGLVPNIVGVDDNGGAVVAGVETTGFVDAHLAFEPHFVRAHFGIIEQVFGSLSATAGPILVTQVGAEKQMFLETRHYGVL